MIELIQKEMLRISDIIELCGYMIYIYTIVCIFIGSAVTFKCVSK